MEWKMCKRLQGLCEKKMQISDTFFIRFSYLCSSKYKL